MHIDQLRGHLTIIKEQIWTVNANEEDFKAIQEEVSQISRTLGVLEVFSDTARWLWKSDKAEKGYRKRSATHQNRVEKVIGKVYGDDTSPEDRLVALSSLDTTTFMFVAASYTPQNLQRLDQKAFECLIDIAPRFVALHSSSSDWIHRKEFQVAVTSSAGSKSAFKRSTFHNMTWNDSSHLYNRISRARISRARTGVSKAPSP
jgi:hypothetical protein